MSIPIPIDRWNGVHKFGTNFDVDTGTTPEDVWDAGGSYSWPAAAATTTIVSGSANDDSAGTGARTVRVYGVDANYVAIDEVATMDGTNAVTLANEYFRVFRMKVLTAGSHDTNVGNLAVKHGATVLAQITADMGQTLMAIYTVPVDYDALYLVKIFATIDKRKTTAATIALQMRAEDGAWQTKVRFGLNSSGGDYQYEYPNPMRVAAKTDIRMRVLDVTTDNTEIDGGFDMIF